MSPIAPLDGNHLWVELAQATAMENQGRDGVVPVEVVDPQDDYVVVAGRVLVVDTALEPTARPIQEHRSVRGERASQYL